MLTIGKRKVQRVDLGGDDFAFVRVMSGRELARFKAVADGPADDVTKMAALVGFTLCDADGKRLLDEGQEDAANDLAYTTLVALSTAALDVNGLTEKKG